MGREAVCTIRRNGEGGEGRLHLDSAAIAFRGAVRGRIARADITRHAADGGVLYVWTAGAAYEFELGEREAAAWARALARPAPTLAEKLGIAPDRRALVIGSLTEPEVLAAIGTAIADGADDAAHLVAELRAPADLAAALARALECGLPVWCLYPKGKGAVPSDTQVRAAFRGAGWVDVKSCAVSASLTGTRYQRRKG